jgi:hypothetical protein
MRWNPWRALRQLDHVELVFADLDGELGLWLAGPDGDRIVIDARLDRRARRCVLAHELVHAERRIGFGAASAATMAREEETVRREVARRLVPAAELRAFVDARCSVAGVALEAIADEFDVTLDVAAKAAELLTRARAASPATDRSVDRSVAVRSDGTPCDRAISSGASDATSG